MNGKDSKLINLHDSDALLIVDVQNDFLPGGSLAVAAGDEILPALNRCIGAFAGRGLPVIATRDWHPAEHCSFVEQGGIWPPHCIAGTDGAALSHELQLPAGATIVSKATEKDADAYSGFERTSLAGQLHKLGVERVFVGGLATDYCVLNTVRDALANGFEVVLLLDAIRAVDLKPDDGQRAIDEMIGSGAMAVRSAQLET